MEWDARSQTQHSKQKWYAFGDALKYMHLTANSAVLNENLGGLSHNAMCVLLYMPKTWHISL